jgi:hypothetical protein
MTSEDEIRSESGSETPASAEFVREVRRAAGWRVAPRHIDAAVQALNEIGEAPTAERVAEIATELHGGRSQRQRRNADLWRLLGAQLTARGKPGDPDAQQAFIGRARAECQVAVSDAMLLTIATSLANANHPLTPVMTGQVADLLASRFDISDETALTEAIETHLDQTVTDVLAERGSDRPRPRRRSGESRPRRD